MKDELLLQSELAVNKQSITPGSLYVWCDFKRLVLTQRKQKNAPTVYYTCLTLSLNPRIKILDVVIEDQTAWTSVRL
jgi:hypothetical protein